MIGPNAIQGAITYISNQITESLLWEFLESNYTADLSKEEALAALTLICKGVIKELEKSYDIEEIVDDFYEEVNK